ncbi:hypothetical protein M3Y98_00042400 [Aphelenchoides besseyi]|nr:hypothetical protein M3Y98_00042400 [Aphelenchoides besseyi]KAI6199027.1 hypothetical protein M3Y96_00583000 [Aphelenchoides besseyi]
MLFRRFVFFFVFLGVVHSWRFFGRGAGNNQFGGYEAARYFSQYPYMNQQPFYSNYPQPYGFNSNPMDGYRSWQRNGVGYYNGPETYRYVGFGSRGSQSVNPYDFYGK